MADRFCESDERRATLAVHTAHKPLHREMTDSDFTSLYTVKSGTPLMCKMRGVDGISNSVVFTPSTGLRPSIAWDSSSNDVTCFPDEESSVFCNRFNVHNCLLYLNQEMTSFGLSPLFAGDADTVDIVRFINNTYHLLKKQQTNETSQAEVTERLQRLDHDINVLSDANDRLKIELDDSEKSAARLELTVSQLRAANRDLSIKLKTEKDEVRRLESVIQHRTAQCLHEARKKEQELEKMKDRMHKLIAEKSVKKTGAGLTMSSTVPKSNSSGETDLFRTVVGTYEDRQKVLLGENNELRRGLLDLQQELVTMLRTDASSAADRNAAVAETVGDRESTEIDSLLPTDAALTVNSHAPGLLSQGCFEMPYDVVGEDVIASLKEKCLLLKEHISNIEKFGQTRRLASSSESIDQLGGECTSRAETEKQQIEMLRNKLCEYEYIIQQHQQLLMQAFQAPNEVSDDVSFLVETDHLEEEEDHALKEMLFRQQKAQLEEDRQKLMDFATQLANQRAEVERLRLEVLHKEFMLLTPFRTNRNQLDATAPVSVSQSTTSLLPADVKASSVTDTPASSSGFLNALPTTADLFRHLGILTTCKRSQDGRGSLDGFMAVTKSAIRIGLSAARARESARSVSDIEEVDNDNDLAIDAVKALKFDPHDEID